MPRSFHSLCGHPAASTALLGAICALGAALQHPGPVRGAAPTPQLGRIETSCQSPMLDMRVLVLATDGAEPELAAIEQTLQYLGTPYTAYRALATPGKLTPAMLAEGCHAHFQAVLTTNAGLVHEQNGRYPSVLSDAEWETLHSFEAAFGLRQANWYASPARGDDFIDDSSGMDTTKTPVSGLLTAEGRQVWSYVNAAHALPLEETWVNLATPAPGGTVVPLLADAQGHALAYRRAFADGREELSLTFSSNPFLLHEQVLAYGLVNWVTRGTFLGERHIYLGVQIDDMFIPNFVWQVSTPCTPNGANGAIGGVSYRISAEDFGWALAWQMNRQANPITQSFRLDLAINAVGSTGKYQPDTLTPYATSYQDQFKWINHTWDHTNLNEVDYAFSRDEIDRNNTAAQDLGLTGYNPISLITPEISGLVNPEFMQAAADAGVRYVVGDTSREGYNNPTPNAGVYNPLQPSILMIPRHPNALGFNVSTPLEWGLEYNCAYRATHGRDYTLDEIVEGESRTLLGYMLRGDMDPWMFHQSNLRTDADGRSLLSTLLDRTLARYADLFTAPVASPTMDQLGARMAERMRYDAAGITATLIPGQSITLTAKQATTAPVTGLPSAGAEQYGGQAISHVPLAAGQSLTLPLK